MTIGIRREDGAGQRLRRHIGTAAVVALALLAAACTGSGHDTSQVRPAANVKTRAAAAVPEVKITPANGAAGADPSAGITVTATGGTLKNVTVRTSGEAPSGLLSQDGRVWHSQWALDVSHAYTVTAVASRSGGGTVTTTSTFRTLTPGRTFTTEILEGYNQAYGVGMPISFTGHLNGVQGAPGMYGAHTLTQTFDIGASLVAIGNTATHSTQIYYNGKLRYNWPISSGRPGDDTPDGSYLTIEKANPVQMTGPGYSLSVPWSVRFTFSGDYYHDAYWSVGEQGFENVSHGCVNLSPADAETYYNLAMPGDPITITGSPKAGTWDNGWTEWFLSWPQYLKGSALHEAVQAGPGGSTFVSPATLPASTATAPLQTAPASNATAR